jgi:CopG family nickel-responsive transcriptional regulator
MTDKHCLEVIVVKGDVKYIRTLSEKIMRLKGVEHVRLTSTAVGKALDLEKAGASNTISP